MAIFAIILREPNSEVQKQIHNIYSEKFELSSTVTIVSTKDTSEAVAQYVGIKGNNRIEEVSGAVVKLQNAYSGHTVKTLWEWLDEHEDDF